MEVPAKKQAFWKKNFDKGDYRLIAKEAKRSPQTITKAIKHGEAHRDIILIIDQYYEAKVQSIQSK